MDKQELLTKLAQIEEHAKDAVAEFPQLAKERLRMIVALTRYLRTEVSESPDSMSDAGLRTGQDGDVNVSNG